MAANNNNNTTNNSNNKNDFNYELISSGRNFEDKFHADSETNSQNDYVFKNDLIRSHSPSHISNDQIIMHTPDFMESNDKDYFSYLNQTRNTNNSNNAKKDATPTNENNKRNLNITPTNEPQKPYTNHSNKHNITPTNENNNKKRNNNNNDINTSFHSYNNNNSNNNYNGYPYISNNHNNFNRVSPNSLSNTRLHRFDNLNSYTSTTNYTNTNSQTTSKGQYENDFFTMFFENQNTVDPFDVNLYGKYYQYGGYQGVNYNPSLSRLGPINGRYNALDDDTFLLDRINARIQKRDVDKQKTPYFDTNTKENKEINLKIDITNNGAKIREFTKSRNSNVTGGLPNITLKPLNNANLNTNRSLDHKSDDTQKYGKNTNKQVNNKNQKNTIPTLPTLNNKPPNKQSPILNNSLNENDLIKNNKSKPNIQYQSLKGEELSRPQNVHEHLYSLSKKGNETSYTEAFKESKKRKGKVINQPHTVNEHRRIANYGHPKEFGDSDEHIDKPTKHSNANNIRDRYNYTQALSDTSPRDYVLSPYINEKFDNNRQYRQYKNYIS